MHSPDSIFGFSSVQKDVHGVFDAEIRISALLARYVVSHEQVILHSILFHEYVCCLTR